MQVNQLGSLCVDVDQLFQGPVEGNQIVAERVNKDQVIIQLNSVLSAALFKPPLAPSVLHQNATHGSRSSREEVTLSIPFTVAVGTDQAQVGLVNQGSRLNGLSWRLTLEFLGRQGAKFLVDDRQEFVGSLAIALFECQEEPGNVVHRRTPKVG